MTGRTPPRPSEAWTLGRWRSFQHNLHPRGARHPSPGITDYRLQVEPCIHLLGLQFTGLALEVQPFWQKTVTTPTTTQHNTTSTQHNINTLVGLDTKMPKMPGQMLLGQMSPWQLESVLDVPRNLSLKIHQNRVSNSWDIAGLKVPVVKIFSPLLYLENGP